ncbi:MAG: DarT ssDNA thymidine ADP-ribosyltransferase family protein [Verrucomicrobia bacterium]|nr:DarT ssDNA thymidine ADP-ribosyltransferase family protein [Verrucomicrobiota bacterium]
MGIRVCDIAKICGVSREEIIEKLHSLGYKQVTRGYALIDKITAEYLAHEFSHKDFLVHPAEPAPTQPDPPVEQPASVAQIAASETPLLPSGPTARVLKFSECLRSHGATALWFMTHLDNLESILKRGILCWNLMQGQAHRDISNPDVQRRRGEMHKYVPLYLADNTAMLYTVVKGDCKIIMLQVNVEAADCEGVRFSDGNAAAHSTRVFDDPTKLSELDWGMILKRSRAMFGEWKRKRMAEVLIPSCCPSTYIQAIHVQSVFPDADGRVVIDVVRSILGTFPNLRIDVTAELTRYGVSDRVR